ncbi:MAG: hypothetical protein ACWGHP_04605 [Stenotrophomonas sp.]
MTVGARIRNEGGSLVQVDPGYENLALRTLGTVVTAQLGPAGRQANCGVVTIQLAGCNEPLLAVRCTSAHVGLRKRTQVGNSYTWELITNSPVTSVDYWIFDTTDVAQMAFLMNKGLRIRNPVNNRIIFDSRYKYLRVINMIGLQLGTGQQEASVPQADGFAMALSNPSLSTVVAGGPIGGTNDWLYQIVTSLAGFRTGSGSVSIARIETNFFTTEGVGNPPYPSGTYGSLQARTMSCDIRNY